MKRRFKIGLTIFCMFLSCLTLTFGVYAAITQSVAVRNYIEFTTEDIYVSVNSLDIYTNNTYTLNKAVRADGFTTKYELFPEDDANWSGKREILFTSSQPYMIFAFSITNLSAEYNANVTVADIQLPSSTTNLDLIKSDGSVASILNGTSNITYAIAKNSTQNIFFSFKVKALETNINTGELKFSLTFTKA